MKPNYDISLEFLQFLYPEGPWMLTAISIDKKSIRADTFHPGQEDEVLKWLKKHDIFNLYYSVNVPVPSAYTKRKLNKYEVHSAHFLHVDVDPRAGEQVDEEQERIRKQIESYRVEPSIVVFSGGGYNALWRLDEPVKIADGALDEEEAVDRAIDFERRNWQLELDFETPDHCRDVSRILRLPGTINRPDAKKISKGRVPALARIHVKNDRSYPLSTFMATPVVSQNKSSNKETKVSTNVKRIETLEELKIPDELKVIIAQGHDPTKEYDGDRSKVVYYVCCELVRCRVPDEIILGIITDSRFGISESVLDKGNSVDRYAHRQLSRAKDNAEHPLLREMNDDFAVILSYGSSTVVMVEKGHFNTQTQRWEPVFQSFRAFRDRVKSYKDVEYLVGEKTKSISAFEWWTRHKRRREYFGVGFEPGLALEDHYNLWTGFSVQPLPGDKHQRLLQHIKEVICDENEESYQYLIKWMARAVQRPRTQSMVCPVLLGHRGVGKSVFTDFFGALFDPHRYVASDVSELTGKFNAHLSSCLLVVAEEAFDLRDKRHESVLKERITGKMIGIERKGLDRIQVPNYMHLIMTSNNERVVPAGDHERRFFVLKVSPKYRQDSKYFAPIIEDRNTGGLNNLLHYLMQVDLSEFDVTNFPRTDGLREQQEHNMAVETQWLMERLEEGTWLPGQSISWEGPVPKPLLHASYRQYLADLNYKFIRGVRAFHQFIIRELPGTTDKQIYYGDRRPMAFIFPPLDECRAMFDENRGWKTNWQEPEAKKEQGDNVVPMRGTFE